MLDFIVATDGSCSKNPGPGAYGYIIRGYIDDRLVLEKAAAYVVEGETTSNRMELAAILFSLYQVQDEMENNSEESSPVVEIISDSQNAIAWLTGAFRVNEPAIAQYVKDIHHTLEHSGIQVKWRHVPGHSHARPDMPRELRMNVKADQMLRDIWKERA